MSKVNCSLDIPQIFREMANLGASYPDVVTVIDSAYKQKNLPGPFVVDALPLPNKAYDEAQLALAKAPSKKDDDLKKTSATSDKNDKSNASKDNKRPSLMQRIGGMFGQ
jgi:hypothetical protein